MTSAVRPRADGKRGGMDFHSNSDNFKSNHGQSISNVEELRRKQFVLESGRLVKPIAIDSLHQFDSSLTPVNQTA